MVLTEAEAFVEYIHACLRSLEQRVLPANLRLDQKTQEIEIIIEDICDDSDYRKRAERVMSLYHGLLDSFHLSKTWYAGPTTA